MLFMLSSIQNQNKKSRKTKATFKVVILLAMNDRDRNKTEDVKLENEALETLIEEYDDEDKIYVLGGGDPNLSPDARRPMR